MIKLFCALNDIDLNVFLCVLWGFFDLVRDFNIGYSFIQGCAPNESELIINRVMDEFLDMVDDMIHESEIKAIEDKLKMLHDLKRAMDTIERTYRLN